MRLRFRDRSEAGQLLAQELEEYRQRLDVIVIGLARGGVPVAFEVAQRLQVRLDLFVVRKLGVPWHPELAMGALAGGGIEVLNEDVVRAYRISADVIRTVAAAEQRELARRNLQYRGDRPFPDFAGCTVILIDDGLATGSTMRAAVAAVRQQHPERIIVAVPVGAIEACEMLRSEVDRAICLRTPRDFEAVGAWYDDFAQTTDDEIRKLLAAASPC